MTESSTDSPHLLTLPPLTPRWIEQSYDDGEFYQQLLRVFISSAGGGAAGGGAGGAGGAGGKRRKTVDRRASKGRKVR